MASKIELFQIVLPLFLVFKTFIPLDMGRANLASLGDAQSMTEALLSPVKQLCQGGGVGRVVLLGKKYVSSPFKPHNCLPQNSIFRFFRPVWLIHCPLALSCSNFTTVLLTMSFGNKEILRDLCKEPSIPLPHLLKASNLPLKRGSESTQPVF